MYDQGDAASFPAKLNAIGILQCVIGGLEVIGGIFYFVWVLFWGLATFGIGLIWIPVPLLIIGVGIMSLISGFKGVNKTPVYGLSLGVAIAQMALLFVCDFISFGFGLASLILLLQEEVKSYFQ